MCGRFVLKASPAELIAQFGLASCSRFDPRYNIAPTQTTLVIRQDCEARWIALPAHWGLMPSWVKDPKSVPQPINAKAETAAIKPMFRHAFRKSRILVPADGYYEWKLIDGKKRPYFIRLRDHSTFGMAGLLEHWQGADGERQTFTILTTQANPLMAAIHDRMPAIVKPENFVHWLDPALTEVETLQRMIGPYPERLMEAYPVSRKVNSPSYDGADLVELANI